MSGKQRDSFDLKAVAGVLVADLLADARDLYDPIVKQREVGKVII